MVAEQAFHAPRAPVVSVPAVAAATAAVAAAKNDVKSQSKDGFNGT